jgi:hypothetical protein
LSPSEQPDGQSTTQSSTPAQSTTKGKATEQPTKSQRTTKRSTTELSISKQSPNELSTIEQVLTFARTKHNNQLNSNPLNFTTEQRKSRPLKSRLQQCRLLNPAQGMRAAMRRMLDVSTEDIRLCQSDLQGSKLTYVNTYPGICVCIYKYVYIFVDHLYHSSLCSVTFAQWS